MNALGPVRGNGSNASLKTRGFWSELTNNTPKIRVKKMGKILNFNFNS